MKFYIKGLFSKCDQTRSFLVTFTEEILNGKFHFFVQCMYLLLKGTLMQIWKLPFMLAFI